MSDEKDDVPDALKRFPAQMPLPQEIHRAISRVDAAWPFLKPIVAVVSNWKAWLVGAGIFAALRNDEILALVDQILGVLK